MVQRNLESLARSKGLVVDASHCTSPGALMSQAGKGCSIKASLQSQLYACPSFRRKLLLIKADIFLCQHLSLIILFRLIEHGVSGLPDMQMGGVLQMYAVCQR